MVSFIVNVKECVKYGPDELNVLKSLLVLQTFSIAYSCLFHQNSYFRHCMTRNISLTQKNPNYTTGRKFYFTTKELHVPL